MKKAIVLGASRGIGKSISDSLKKLDLDVISLSSNDIDTSNLNSVNKFANQNNSTDILVLNTGGPPIKMKKLNIVLNNLKFFIPRYLYLLITRIHILC